MKKEIKIIINEDDSLYISDILCWMEGFLTGKGEDFRDYDLLNDAVKRLKEINSQIKKF